MLKIKISYMFFQIINLFILIEIKSNNTLFPLMINLFQKLKIYIEIILIIKVHNFLKFNLKVVNLDKIMNLK